MLLSLLCPAGSPGGLPAVSDVFLVWEESKEEWIESVSCTARKERHLGQNLKGGREMRQAVSLLSPRAGFIFVRVLGVLGMKMNLLRLVPHHYSREKFSVRWYASERGRTEEESILCLCRTGFWRWEQEVFIFAASLV